MWQPREDRSCEYTRTPAHSKKRIPSSKGLNDTAAAFVQSSYTTSIGGFQATNSLLLSQTAVVLQDSEERSLHLLVLLRQTLYLSAEDQCCVIMLYAYGRWKIPLATHTQLRRSRLSTPPSVSRRSQCTKVPGESTVLGSISRV